ncbi:MAG: CDP-alcohol phosphatidyltransferase family protein [Ilumatobacter sp.]|uniref:CDP-alcohol phosphatidyltransferase family protein n=1 Tax=Ilumatobacter sp. TaxID=1967498 RepID=UPI00391A62F5
MPSPEPTDADEASFDDGSSEGASSEGASSEGASSEGASSEGVFDNIWTLPNLFTLIRLLCLPLFLYLLFAQDNRAGAAWLLAGLGSTDWVDGYVARRFDQTSEFGKVFDPTVDRLLFIVAVTAIIIDGSIPLWFAIAVLAREVIVGGVIAFATLFLRMERFGVTWLGKVATFMLMGAVPSFLIGTTDVWEAPFFEVLAWLLGIPGLLLSYWTGIAYIPLVRQGIAAGRTSATTSTALVSSAPVPAIEPATETNDHERP